MLALEANSEVDSIYRTVYQSEGKDIYMVDQIVKNSQGSASYIATAARVGDLVVGMMVQYRMKRKKSF